MPEHRLTVIGGIGRRLVIDPGRGVLEPDRPVQSLENVQGDLCDINPVPGEEPQRGPQLTPQVPVPVAGLTAFHSACEGLQTGTGLLVVALE